MKRDPNNPWWHIKVQKPSCVYSAKTKSGQEYIFPFSRDCNIIEEAKKVAVLKSNVNTKSTALATVMSNAILYGTYKEGQTIHGENIIYKYHPEFKTRHTIERAYKSVEFDGLISYNGFAWVVNGMERAKEIHKKNFSWIHGPDLYENV